MLQEAKTIPYKTFRKYLNMVFMYAGTASLFKRASYGSLYFTASRRCVYQRRFTGPCRDSSRMWQFTRKQKRKFFIGAKYMPAQQIHILVNPAKPNLSPWYELTDTDSADCIHRSGHLKKKELKRF